MSYEEKRKLMAENDSINAEKRYECSFKDWFKSESCVESEEETKQDHSRARYQSWIADLAHVQYMLFEWAFWGAAILSWT